MPYNWDLHPSVTGVAEDSDTNVEFSRSELVLEDEEYGHRSSLLVGYCPTCGRGLDRNILTGPAENQSGMQPMEAVETYSESEMSYTGEPEDSVTAISEKLHGQLQTIETPQLESTQPPSRMGIVNSPEIIDLTMPDDDTKTDIDQPIRNLSVVGVGTGRSKGRCSWNESEKRDVYLLKLVYDISNDDVAKILTPCHQQPRVGGAIRWQFDDHRSKPENARIFAEIMEAIDKNNLQQYSGILMELKSAALQLGIVLRPKYGVIDPFDIATSSIKAPKALGPPQETRDSQSLPSFNGSDASDEGLRRNGVKYWNNIPGTTKKLDPRVLFRVYDRYSHGKNGPDDFRAGRFVEKAPGLVTECELYYFDVALSRHISRSVVKGGSVFISTTPSLFWALHKATRMANPRISVFDRSKISQPSMHVSSIRSRLKTTGLLDKTKYSGKLEYVVYGAIEAEAIIQDFSFEQFKALVNSHYRIRNLVCPEVLFSKKIKGSLSKLQMIRETGGRE